MQLKSTKKLFPCVNCLPYTDDAPISLSVCLSIYIYIYILYHRYQAISFILVF